MRVLIIAATLLAACGAARSDQSLAQKGCTIQAAGRLPAVPGLTIVSVSAGAAVPEAMLSKIVGAFGTAEQAAIALNGSILIANVTEIVRLHNSPEPVGKKMLMEAILPNLSDAFDVVISVKAAGLDAKYEYACAVSRSGRFYAGEIGIVE